MEIDHCSDKNLTLIRMMTRASATMNFY